MDSGRLHCLLQAEAKNPNQTKKNVRHDPKESVHFFRQVSLLVFFLRGYMVIIVRFLLCLHSSFELRLNFSRAQETREISGQSMTSADLACHFPPVLVPEKYYIPTCSLSETNPGSLNKLLRWRELILPHVAISYEPVPSYFLSTSLRYHSLRKSTRGHPDYYPASYPRLLVSERACFSPEEHVTLLASRLQCLPRNAWVHHRLPSSCPP